MIQYNLTSLPNDESGNFVHCFPFISETTLMKLKEGSQRCQSLPPTDAISADVSCITATDSPETIGADCSSSDSSLNSSDQSTSMCFSTEKQNKTLSVLYLFSKYKSTKNIPTSLEEDSMVIENDCSSVNTSPSVDNSPFIISRRQQLPEECFDSEMI